MLKTERLQIEGQVLILNAPLLGQIEKFPFAAAFAASVIMTVLLSPAGILPLCIPDHLRVGTHKRDITPTLQLFAAACIEHLEILPIRRRTHMLTPRSQRRFPLQSPQSQQGLGLRP